MQWYHDTVNQASRQLVFMSADVVVTNTLLQYAHKWK